MIHIQCLCLKCYKLDVFRNSFKRNKSQSYLRIIVQNFKEWRFFKKLIILALFFHLLEHFVSVYLYIVYMCVFWKSRLTVSIFEALNQIWFHCFGVFSGTNWLLSSSDGGGWRPNSHFIAWHTSTTKSFCTWWNLFCLKNLDRMLLHASFSLYFWGQTYYIFHLICSLNKKTYSNFSTRDWRGEIGLSE